MGIDYQSLIDEAMLSIVRKILLNTQGTGLDEEQSFYLSFRTDHPEVILSKHVRKRYPKEITVVLQYQYRDLNVLEDRFSVNIAFSGIPETIEVPFAALTGFVDPIVNFSLQFRKNRDLLEEVEISIEESPMISKIETKPKEASSKKTEKKAGEVIAIDKFRRKK